MKRVKYIILLSSFLICGMYAQAFEESDTSDAIEAIVASDHTAFTFTLFENYHSLLAQSNIPEESPSLVSEKLQENQEQEIFYATLKEENLEECHLENIEDCVTVDSVETTGVSEVDSLQELKQKVFEKAEFLQTIEKLISKKVHLYKNLDEDLCEQLKRVHDVEKEHLTIHLSTLQEQLEFVSETLEEKMEKSLELDKKIEEKKQLYELFDHKMLLQTTLCNEQENKLTKMRMRLKEVCDKVAQQEMFCETLIQEGKDKKQWIEELNETLNAKKYCINELEYKTSKKKQQIWQLEDLLQHRLQEVEDLNDEALEKLTQKIFEEKPQRTSLDETNLSMIGIDPEKESLSIETSAESGTSDLSKIDFSSEKEVSIQELDEEKVFLSDAFGVPERSFNGTSSSYETSSYCPSIKNIKQCCPVPYVGAYSLLGEISKKHLRGSAAYGSMLTQDTLVKVSGEYLSQKLKFDFQEDIHRKWVSQYGIGLESSYALGCCFFRDLNVNVKYAHSNAYNFDEFNDHIAKGWGIFSSLGASFFLNFGLLYAMVDYDYVAFNHSITRNDIIRGFGGTVGYFQKLPFQSSVFLLAEMRQPYDNYKAEVNVCFSLCNLALRGGLFGQYTDGKYGIPNFWTGGLIVSLIGRAPGLICRSSCGSSCRDCRCSNLLKCTMTTPFSEQPIVLNRPNINPLRGRLF